MCIEIIAEWYTSDHYITTKDYHEIQRIILDADRSALTEVWRYEAAHLLVLWVFGANNVHTSLSVLSAWSRCTLTVSRLTS